MRVLLLAPTDHKNVAGGQARAGAILVEQLRAAQEITFSHCVQPSIVAESSAFRVMGRRIALYWRFICGIILFKPEIIHAFSPCSFAGLLEKSALCVVGRALGARIILNLRNDPEVLIAGLPAWKRNICYWAMSLFDAYICQYEGLEEFYVARVGADPEDVFTVHNSISGAASDLSDELIADRFRRLRLVRKRDHMRYIW